MLYKYVKPSQPIYRPPSARVGQRNESPDSLSSSTSTSHSNNETGKNNTNNSNININSASNTNGEETIN